MGPDTVVIIWYIEHIIVTRVIRHNGYFTMITGNLLLSMLTPSLLTDGRNGRPLSNCY